MPNLGNRCLLAAAAMLTSVPTALAQTPEPVPVCVGADRVVRHAPGGTCPAGQTLYRLSQGGVVGAAKEGEKTPADVEDLLRQIGFLRERLAQLEKHVEDELEAVGRMSHQVMAPFEVVDKKLNTILAVTETSSDPKRGLVTIRPAGGDQLYAIQFRTPGGLVNAQFGLGKSGAGIVAVNDAAGNERGELWGGRGLQLYNPGGQEVASLSLDTGNNGTLQLNAGSGGVMVVAGTEGPAGFVRTGPGYLCSGNAGLRTPSCIKGLLK